MNVQWLRSIGLLLTAFFFAIQVVGSTAADIRILPESTAELKFIGIFGNLEPVDGRKFANIAMQHDRAVVVMSSDGGSLIAGIEIGKAIRLKEFWTLVGANGRCASACGLAWLGGIRRLAHPTALVGFHAAYVTEGGETKETGAGNGVVGAYFNQLGLPQSVVIYLTSAPPDGMEWLPLEKARSMGIDLEIVGENAVANPAPTTVPDKHQPTTAAVPSLIKRVQGYDVFGFDLANMPLRNIGLDACEKSCQNDPSCNAYTFNTPNSLCFLKSSGYRVMGNPNAVAGYRAEIESKLVLSPITVIEKSDLPGGDYKSLGQIDFENCVSVCEADSQCAAFTFVRRQQTCWLKSSVPSTRRNRNAISGIKLRK